MTPSEAPSAPGDVLPRPTPAPDAGTAAPIPASARPSISEWARSDLPLDLSQVDTVAREAGARVFVTSARTGFQCYEVFQFLAEEYGEQVRGAEGWELSVVGVGGCEKGVRSSKSKRSQRHWRC